MRQACPSAPDQVVQQVEIVSEQPRDQEMLSDVLLAAHRHLVGHRPVA